ncbi:MAG: hypothetical protein J5I41_06010 [Saprospiraceae bacterium]|nr:hypothetical protein [Saprospiraceae bacterium]
MNRWQRATLGTMLWVTAGSALPAQHTFTVSIAQHAISLPGGSFSAPLHPGVDAGWWWQVRTGRRWSQGLTARAGYFHQRLVHHGVQLFGEYTWHYRFLPGLLVGMGGGLGYLHTFEQHHIFRLKSDGTYERTGRLGKPHVQASAVLSIQAAPTDWRVRPFLLYRFRVMSPFVQEYVPFLPATSLHLGVMFDLTFQRPES